MPKKRNHGDGALFELKSRGLWRGVADAGFKPDGSRDQRYVHAKTQREARAKLEALKAEIKEHGAPLDKTMTVEAWANHWLDTIAGPKVGPNTIKVYRSMTTRWILPVLGRKRISALKPSDMRAVTKAITDAGLSTGTASKAHNIMSGMLESARLDGVAGRNVARDVVAPTVLAAERGALSTEHAFSVIRAALGREDGTRWLFALLTGMRQGERLGATLDSIDFERREFTVRWSLAEVKFRHGCGGTCSMKRAGACPQRVHDIRPGLRHRILQGRLVLLPPKSGKTRTFPLIPQLAAPLTQYLHSMIDRPNPHGLIWRNTDGSPITATQDNDEWRSLLLEAGVITEGQALRPKDREPGTPQPPTGHWARHTTVTVLMELGVDPKIIGEIVGHGTERITRHYQHVSSDVARAAMDAIGERFRLALEQAPAAVAE